MKQGLCILVPKKIKLPNSLKFHTKDREFLLALRLEPENDRLVEHS